MIRRPSEVMLPSIEQCLFGPTRECPVIVMPPTCDDGDDDDDDNVDNDDTDPPEEPTTHAATERTEGDTDDTTQKPNNNGFPQLDGFSSKISTSAIDILYDSLDLGHWAEAAKQHDIHMEKLRKVASHGIPDEGSFRGITWRILLNYLPPKEIHESWGMQIPPKRDFYRQLVHQYFPPGTMEDGRLLRGQLTKTLRNRKLRQQQKKNAILMGTVKEEPQPPSAAEDAASDGSSSEANSTITAPTVEELLPPKFREQWKRSGITLDKMSTATSTGLDLNLNYLKVPSFADTPKSSAQATFQDFLEDAKLLEEIRKDVARTLPHLLFFLEPNDNLGLRRYAALERILFLWAKLNKGVRYVQGMNEIAGTLYYVLANDHNREWANYAEADTYFLFHALMMDIRDVFVPDMDSHSTGIQGRIETMERLLETHDPEVCAHLRKCGIDSHFWAYRWLTTLLSREFLLPDTIRLWDSMFASTHKDNFLRYVCVTMVIKVRDRLLEGDFSANLRLLQRFPPVNVDEILDSSRSLWMYETKINMLCEKNGLTVDAALQMVSPPPRIIMAFGLKGGVAPNFKHRLEDATGHLLGRAQRFLSKWNEAEATSAPADSAPAPAAAVSEPLTRSRFWNRARRNTEDSDTSNNQASQIASASASTSTVPTINVQVPTNGGGNPSSTDANTAAPGSGFSSSTTPRRTIWNRSPVSRTPDRMGGTDREVATPESVPLPTLQASFLSGSTATPNPPSIDSNSRRPLWKNGGWDAKARGTAAT